MSAINSATTSRRELPRRHQNREVPGNDLADDAKRFMKMIGDSVVVYLGNAAFLGAHGRSEIAPVIDDERHVGIGGFADRLAVVERLDERQQFQIGFQLVGDLVEKRRPLLHGGLAPGFLRRMRGVERKFDIGRGGARYLTELLAGDRARIVEIASFDRSDPLAADEIIVAVANENLFGDFLQSLLKHWFPPGGQSRSAPSFRCFVRRPLCAGSMRRRSIARFNSRPPARFVRGRPFAGSFFARF
jgi:hypothetical protein